MPGNVNTDNQEDQLRYLAIKSYHVKKFITKNFEYLKNIRKKRMNYLNLLYRMETEYIPITHDHIVIHYRKLLLEYKLLYALNSLKKKNYLIRIKIKIQRLKRKHELRRQRLLKFLGAQKNIVNKRIENILSQTCSIIRSYQLVDSYPK